MTPAWLVRLDLGGFGAVVRGEQLRRWSLSETWRVWNADGASLVVKRGTGACAREVDVYRRLLHPGLPVPRLVAAHREPGAVTFALTDLGGPTLEQHPTPEGYLAAVRTLARIRCATTDPAGTPVEDELVPGRVRDRLATLRPDLAPALDTAVAVLPRHLARLRDTVPVTLVHNDFHAKNLIPTEAGVAVVDWSDATPGRHLGDLYGLLREAREHRIAVDTSALTGAYATELDSPGEPPLPWQVDLGGLVWILGVLDRIAERHEAMPFALDWLDGLATEAAVLAVALAAAPA